MKSESALLGYRFWTIIYPAAPLLVVAALAWRRPDLGRAALGRLERGGRRLAAHRGWSWALILGVSLTISLAISCLIRWPEPVIADEFSYLLAAETFAAGRLTNPPHPFWPHFESLHLIQQPTYASKYQPGPGLVLAAAQRLTGTPVIGLWLVSALASLAVGWMLRAWLREHLALLGALLAALHPLILEWGQNFWGGGLALTGGSLTLGALGRLWQTPRRRDGLILGAGLGLLALCRPFEGALLGLLGGLFTLYAIWRREIPRTQLAGIVLAPLLALAPTAAFIGYYNWRVTGEARLMPYLVHQRTYAIATPFLWQPLQAAPTYRHDSIRRFYLEYELPSWQGLRSPAGLLRRGLIRKLDVLRRSYFATSAMALGLLLFPVVWRRDRRLRRLWLLFALFLGGVLTETWLLPHYIAPAAGLLFLATVAGWRRLRVWRRGGKRVGLLLARAALIGSLLGVVNLGFRLGHDHQTSWAWVDARSRLERELPRDGRRHLILVRYGPNHNVHQEWVYNGATIDQSPVVWAHEMDDAANERLIGYYGDRSCHLAIIDGGAPMLQPCLAEVFSKGQFLP